MKIVTKLAIASVLALSVAAPAFAAEETTLVERTTHTIGTHLDAMAYAPAHTTAKTNAVRDLGIGSQG